MIHDNCRDCKNYHGDCGKHFMDAHNHIVYDIPSEAYMVGAIGLYGSCFEPSERYLKEVREIKVQAITEKYNIEELEAALREMKGENP